jgi:hypothetical protein
MEAHNISRVLQDGGKQHNGTLADLVRMIRGETLIAVQHAMLLADPRHDRKRGGSRAAFWAALDAIEERGGVIWELYTGLRTDRPGERDKMTRAAIDALARGRHKTRQSDKRGRPAKQFTEEQWAKAQAAWESMKLKTWADVAPKLPKGMTPRDCWNRFGARSAGNSEER